METNILYLTSNSRADRIMAEVDRAREIAKTLRAELDQLEGWSSLSGVLQDCIAEIEMHADEDEMDVTKGR